MNPFLLPWVASSIASSSRSASIAPGLCGDGFSETPRGSVLGLTC